MMIPTLLAVVLGVQDGLKLDPLELITQPEYSRAPFQRILSVGDLDGDGFTEFVVAQRGNGHPTAGHPARIYLFDGFDRRILRRWTPPNDHDFRHRFGWSLALARHGSAGPPVLVVADPEAPADGKDSSGEIVLIDLLGGDIVGTIQGKDSMTLGNFMVSGFDLDGDGYDEVFAGAPGAENSNGDRFGAAILYDGATLTERYRFSGSSRTESLEGPLDWLDDLDGDDIPDLLIGSPSYISGSEVVGRVIILSGVDGSTIWSGAGQADRHRYGALAMRLGDLTGDGRAEFAWMTEQKKRLLIFDGVPGTPFFDLDISGESSHPQTFERIGDRTGDGVPEFLIAGRFPNGRLPGRISVFSGADASVALRIEADRQDFLFGVGVSELDDVTGDGTPDLAVVSTGSYPDYGEVRLYQTRSLFRTKQMPSVTSTGGTASVRLEAPAHASRPFALLLSTSSKTGTPLGTRTIPLDPTALFTWSAFHPTFGTFDSEGHAVVSIRVPHSSFAIDRVRACWVGLDDQAPLGARGISNALNVRVD